MADSSLTLAEEEAYFVLAYHSGEILLVKQTREGKITSIDLKSESLVPRFLSGLADKLRYVLLPTLRPQIIYFFPGKKTKMVRQQSVLFYTLSVLKLSL